MPGTKKKCFHCNMKLGIVNFTCKCTTKRFCSKCRLPENHNCTYDFKQESKEKLTEKLVKVEFKKVISI